MFKPVLTLLTASFLLTGCAYFRSSSDRVDTTGFDLAQVKADMKPLDFSKPYQPTEAIEAIEEYFIFYGLNSTNVQHNFGTIESKGEILAGHVYMPKQPRGALFLIHGYFDHVGTLSKLITESLARGYAVVVWDLPGHGLSSGERTDTGAFDLCGEQFIDLVKRSDDHLPRPFHLIAHSTGCSIAIEYLQNPDPDAFEQIVFLSPLVKHKHWGWAKFGYAISLPFTKSVRRRDKKNSSDEAYLAFVKKDPLHSSVLSYEYLKDLYHWEEQVQSYPVWPGSIAIVQGDQDDIVDWEYNIEFLQSKIENTEVFIIPGARHQLANEREELRTMAFDAIFDYLDQPNNP